MIEQSSMKRVTVQCSVNYSAACTASICADENMYTVPKRTLFQ